MIRYDNIAPEPPAEQEEYCILDEAAEFREKYVVEDPRQRDAAVLLAAMTWAAAPSGAFFTIPRALWTSAEARLEETGKTTAMMTTVLMSANPEDASGTYAALRSALAEVSNTPENPLRTFYLDEVGDEIFGEAGTNRGGNPVFTKFAKKGYKRGATDSYSRNSTKYKFPINYPLFMSSKDVGLPRDLRGRTIVFYMEAGSPPNFLYARDEEDAKDLGKAIGRVVGEHLAELAEFRALRYHPRLIKRRLEVWESLFAVAKVIGGQRWLNRCMQAFLLLALDSNQTALSPRERILRDLDAVVAQVQVTLPDGREFVSGLALAEELRKLGKPYEDKTVLGVSRDDIAESMPVAPRQVRVASEVIRGYWVKDIRNAWDAIRPVDPDDVEEPDEEDNPFDVTDVTDASFDAVFVNDSLPAATAKSRVSRTNKEKAA